MQKEWFNRIFSLIIQFITKAIYLASIILFVLGISEVCHELNTVQEIPKPPVANNDKVPIEAKNKELELKKSQKNIRKEVTSPKNGLGGSQNLQKLETTPVTIKPIDISNNLTMSTPRISKSILNSP